MPTSMSRRSFTKGSVAAAVAGSSVFSPSSWNRVFAQATPEASAVAGLNYPELVATILDQEVQLSADSVPAGYILLTVVNKSSSEAGAGVLGPGPGQTMDDLQAAASTPSTGDEFPPFFYTATIVGGTGSAQPGETLQVVIHLAEGDWVAFAEGSQPPAFFSATSEGATDQAPPAATATITEVDFAFGGISGTFPAGQQVWEVVNQGKQPHMLVLGQIPDGATFAQVLQAVGSPPDATPAPGEFGEDDFQYRGGVLLQSPGTTVWPLLDLQAGHYAAICFVPDPDHGGVPHAMEGMIAVFDVE